jgi:TubC N-terminal docking domain
MGGDLNMKVTELLSQCATLGVTLTPGDEGTLRVSPPGILTTELRVQLKAHKTALLQLLTAPPADALIDDPCAMCGSRERWQWLDGRLLCRVCVVLDLMPMSLLSSVKEGA